MWGVLNHLGLQWYPIIANCSEKKSTCLHGEELIVIKSFTVLEGSCHLLVSGYLFVRFSMELVLGSFTEYDMLSFLLRLHKEIIQQRMRGIALYSIESFFKY